jgi:drug/metabolite transporter (DMT)-like permease
LVAINFIKPTDEELPYQISIFDTKLPLMVFLVVSIILNSLIFAIFKWFGLRQVNTFQAIVVNYFVCVLTGTIFTGADTVLNQSPDNEWLYIALGLGAVFITIFYLMAITAQKFSMAAASIASKMAFVVPVIFSIYFLKVASEFEWYNIIGVGLALLATYLSSASDGKLKVRNRLLWLLPFFVFLGNGLIDTTINYTNLNFLDTETAAVFPIYIFLSSAVIGGIILLIKGTRLTTLSLLSGLVLGVTNYFTVYVFLIALGQLDNNGAFVFPIFNTGIVVLSALIGIIVFKEKLSKLNKAGILLAVVAIVLVML